MVERSVCSIEGEDNTSRSISGNVETVVVCRNEDLKAPEVTGSFEKASDNQKSREPCLSRITESSKLTVSRDESKGIPIGGGRFSLFKWFKRGSRDTSWRERERSNRSIDQKCDRESSDLDENDITSDELLSSNESVETLYSTATVRSFAFKVGDPAVGSEVSGEDTRRHLAAASFASDFTDSGSRRVGPFGVGAAKIAGNPDEAKSHRSTRTLPTNVSSRRLDITARYSLQSCNGISGGFGSCGNFAGDKEDWVKRPRAGGNRGRVRVHVRGKRRAPDPPEVTRGQRTGEETISSQEKTGRRKKRRQAPKPPDVGFEGRRVSVNLAGDKHTGSAVSAEDILGSIAIRETGSDSVNANGETGSGERDGKGRSRLAEREEINGPSLKVEEITSRHDIPEVAKKEDTPGIVDLAERVGGMNVGKTDAGSKRSDGLGEVILPGESLGSSENWRKKSKLSDDADRIEDRILSSDEKLTRSDAVVIELSKTAKFPLPVEVSNDLEPAGTISNDSLVLQGGVLHSKRDSGCSSNRGVTLGRKEAEGSQISRRGGNLIVATGSQTSSAAMPRPWYKRNVFEHNRDSGTSKRNDLQRNSTCREAQNDGIRDEKVSSVVNVKSCNSEKPQDGGTLGRLNFFHRSERSTEERKKDNSKRKSGLTMLANISELDKEAAAIVQEEQARTRAAAKLLQATNEERAVNDEETEDVVQEIVTSVMESSPRRGTRALISKFNAISNRTRVTVNTSFFAKNSSSAKDGRMEKVEAPKSFRDHEWRESGLFSKSQNIRTDKDLSRYFLPAKKSAEAKKIVEPNEASTKEEITWKNSTDVSARLSFFQNIPSERKNVAGIRENTLETKMASSRENNFPENPGNSKFHCSPIFSRFEGFKEDWKSDEAGQKRLRSSFETERPKGDEERINERELMKKEFSDIFREIDEKLSSNEFNVDGRMAEASTSGRISKVLDILVEAEKKEGTNFPRSAKVENVSSEKTKKNAEETRTARGSTCGLPVSGERADLREILKEMKHSLPKRPKPKRVGDRESSSRNSIDAGTTTNETRREAMADEEVRVEGFSPESSRSKLLTPVKVVYPPPIRIGGSAFGDDLERAMVRRRDEGTSGDHERQKVSSSAQTSGNLRKLTDRRVYREETSKWQNEDVIYRTSGKGVATGGASGLTKNTFQLIRPREFARIEAIKTMKNSGQTENTYANVMDRSLYANAIVTAKEKNHYGESTRNAETRRNYFDDEKLRDHGGATTMEAEITAPDATTAGAQNMNTLAVNRLLRKLEAAIASGHHQQAAGLAKELATLKIHCSVVRQRTEKKDLINVNMYIEDKLAHQGPIPLRLTRAMTVAELKAKVFTEFEIPVNVQRWIVGKNLANDDTTRLVDLQAVEGSSVFLYLVAPELKIDEAPSNDDKVALAVEEAQKDFSPKESDNFSNLSTPGESTEAQSIVEEEEEEEEEENEKCVSEEVRMERYEALISLENCDVIPNSEPIECPICFVTYGPQEGVILRDCLHIFCRPCIANTIRYCEEAEVKCPYRDTEYTCESTLQEREIKALVEPEVYQQHLAKSIAQAENNAGNNAFHCKTPDCPGWCIYDDNVNNFLCPVCGVNNCLTCQVVHTGKNCRQYQEELRMSKETDQESKRTAAMLEEMVDRGEALPCPTCAVVLMKKWGCDWLRCSMCKTEICWVTRGPRWGPGGKGDTSGGCRCGEKGIKCHPRCNYCH